jgi:hypothetical protein
MAFTATTCVENDALHKQCVCCAMQPRLGVRCRCDRRPLPSAAELLRGSAGVERALHARGPSRFERCCRAATLVHLTNPCLFSPHQEGPLCFDLLSARTERRRPLADCKSGCALPLLLLPSLCQHRPSVGARVRPFQMSYPRCWHWVMYGSRPWDASCMLTLATRQHFVSTTVPHSTTRPHLAASPVRVC